MKIAYLGPAGSYTEEAGLYFAKENDEQISASSIYDIFKKINNKEVNKIIVPFENSIEGTVTQTLDSLVFSDDLYIQSELNLKISHSLLVKDIKQKIKKIISHPQALAQSRNYIYEKYKNIEFIETSSTSNAAKIVSESNGDIAAISNKRCADIYNLQILEEDIQDNKNNTTRFLEICNEKNKIFNDCKTSIAFKTLHKPGELYKILNIISLWDLNMSKIESRPSKNILGEYYFFVDLNNIGNFEDLENAELMIQRKTSFYKNMGYYKNFEGGL